MTTTFRAAYFVAADGQSDVSLAADDTLTDAELIEAAVAEAHNIGMIGERDEDSPHLISEEELRAGLHIGDYTA